MTKKEKITAMYVLITTAADAFQLGQMYIPRSMAYLGLQMSHNFTHHDCEEIEAILARCGWIRITPQQTIEITEAGLAKAEELDKALHG